MEAMPSHIRWTSDSYGVNGAKGYETQSVRNDEQVGDVAA